MENIKSSWEDFRDFLDGTRQFSWLAREFSSARCRDCGYGLLSGQEMSDGLCYTCVRDRAGR